MRFPVLSLAFAIHTLATQLPAQKTPEDETASAASSSVQEEIVVTANRFEAPASTVGSSVTVIDAAEIERRRQLTVSDLLRTVAGIEISQTGGPGKVSSLRLRGGDASHALVLVDGLRVNSTTTGDVNFADLLTDAVDRIEILRGPQATYGSEAVTGVVSITTRRGRQGLHPSAVAEAGSHDLARFQLALDGGRGPVDYSFSASDYRTDGVSAASEERGNTEADPYDNQTATGRLGLGFGKDGRVDLTLRYFQGDTAVDGFSDVDFLPADDLNARQETESLTTALTLKTSFSPRWSQTFTLGTTDNDLLGTDRDTFFNNFEIKSRISQFESQSDFALSQVDMLTLGLSVEKRQGENVGGFDESAYLRSAYLQNAWSLKRRLYLTGAVRHDDHSQFGHETTYRLTAALLFPATATRLHGSFGTSFRAPDFNELYFPFAGDPNLRPETGRGLDFGIEQSWLEGRLKVDVTYFENDLDDLIDFDLATFTFNNILAARSDGYEATLWIAPGDGLDLVLSHTLNDTENRTSGRQLARRPKNRSTAVLSFDVTEALRGVATLYVVRDRIDADTSRMDDYERLDLTLEYGAGRRFRPYVRLENLLDEDYEEVTYFTTPGFTGAVGLGLRF